MRRALAQLQTVRRMFSEFADWVWLYTREAHPEVPCWSDPLPCGRPQDVQGRARAVCTMAAVQGLAHPLLVDHTAARNQCTEVFSADSGVTVITTRDGAVLDVIPRERDVIGVDPGQIEAALRRLQALANPQM